MTELSDITEAQKFYESQLSQQDINECRKLAESQRGDFSKDSFTFNSYYVQLLSEKYKSNGDYYFRRGEWMI